MSEVTILEGRTSFFDSCIPVRRVRVRVFFLAQNATGDLLRVEVRYLRRRQPRFAIEPHRLATQARPARSNKLSTIQSMAGNGPLASALVH